MRKYFEKMASDGRLIQIFEDGKQVTFLTFSICNNYTPYKDKDIWEYLPHDPSGRICFIEKLASIRWNKELRMQLENAILEKYPQIEETVWFRPTHNEERKVTRRIYAKSL